MVAACRQKITIIDIKPLQRTDFNEFLSVNAYFMREKSDFWVKGNNLLDKG